MEKTVRDDLKFIKKLLNGYVDNKVSFKELSRQFDMFYIDSDFEYTDDQIDILEEINTDIGMTETDREIRKEDDYLSESELRLKIKGNLAKL